MSRFWQRIIATQSNQGMSRAAEVPPFFNVVAETEDAPAEIVLFGDVLTENPRNWWTGEPEEGMYITVEEALAKLDEIKDAKEILIRLNSSGGDLFAGIAIHNMIKGLAGHKKVRVEGLAASAASIIMCAGDEIELYPGSMVMIHNVAAFLFGFYCTREVRGMLGDMEACERSMKAIYAAKCGKPDEELQNIIDATTWYVGQEAVDAGFADALIDDDPEEVEVEALVTNEGKYLMVAGVRHSIQGIANMPEDIARYVAEATREYKADAGEPQEEKEGEVEITNTNELRQAYPDLVASLEATAKNEGAAAERARIEEIEKVSAKIGDSKMVADAKFGDSPKDAQTLVYEAAMSDKLGNGGFMAALEADGKNSNTDEVDNETSTEEDDPEKKEQEEIDDVINSYVNSRGNR